MLVPGLRATERRERRIMEGPDWIKRPGEVRYGTAGQGKGGEGGVTWKQRELPDL